MKEDNSHARMLPLFCAFWLLEFYKIVVAYPSHARCSSCSCVTRFYMNSIKLFSFRPPSPTDAFCCVQIYEL